jgi:N-methylhydantoinase A/oxoprolinase/acetone carboxylase beta subunit
VVRLDRLTAAPVATIFRALEEAATRALLRMGAVPEAIRLERSVEMRYVGQGYQVTVPVTAAGGDTGLDAESLRAAFEGTYRAAYGLVLEGRRIEALTWRVAGRAPRPGGSPEALGLAARLGRDGRRPSRAVFFPEAGDFVPCAIYDRYALEPGFEARGPAVIEEREATTVVGPGGSVAVDGRLNLRITVEKGRVP